MSRRAVIISGAKLALGGVRTHLVLLCRLLLKRGTEVSLFANGSHWSDDLLAELRALGLRIYLPPASLRGAPLLGMIHAGLMWPIQVPRRADSLYCTARGASHLWLHRLRPPGTVSINYESSDAPSPNSIAGRCAAELDVTAANSRKVAALMQKTWPGKPIRAIPCLNTEGPMPAPARDPGWRKSGPLRVTYLGRLDPLKRAGQLVRCWQGLTANPELSGARLDLYGDDPGGIMLAELRHFSAQHRLSAQVQLHGGYELERLPHILAQSDAVVLPSLVEGLPMVLVEAMLHGVPFVATSAGGTEELAEGNPDVVLTGMEWGRFESGLRQLAARVRSGMINPRRLHAWAEARYGYAAVSQQWLQCLHYPREFFGLDA